MRHDSPKVGSRRHSGTVPARRLMSAGMAPRLYRTRRIRPSRGSSTVHVPAERGRPGAPPKGAWGTGPSAARRQILEDLAAFGGAFQRRAGLGEALALAGVLALAGI